MLRDKSLIPLSQQHHNGLAFCVLAGRSLKADSSAANVATLAKRAVERYEIELVNHFEMEERILFPALSKLPIVEELIAEHRRLEAIVDALRSSPSIKDLKDFMTLLQSHIRREETEFFESAQQILSRQTLDELGAQIDAQAVRVCL